ncbi:hypothetical protein JW752_02455 [Candidatus Peregrinibacteria bacterium]|nr:hypothetical protein [Candidatus Peregrinibacteria bacterium]
MRLQEGKNIETLLAGRVQNPLSEAEYERQIQELGLPAIRRRLSQTLNAEMAKVRRNQKEKNPSNPKGLFARNLLMDLDESLGFICDMADGEKYDLRFYSAVDTSLDFSGSFDCWVELFDLEKNIPLADYKIDITTNPNKVHPSNLADAVLYFDDSYVDPDFKGEIDPRFFESDEYKTLVELAALRLAQRANIKFLL